MSSVLKYIAMLNVHNKQWIKYYYLHFAQESLSHILVLVVEFWVHLTLFPPLCHTAPYVPIGITVAVFADSETKVWRN